MLQTLI